MDAVPEFLRLAGHPVRWRAMTALARGDLRVRELVELVGEPQNAVSYHLRLLRDAGLVTAARSSADGRDTYYHLDLDRCAGALAGVGAALQGPPPPAGPVAVLFVCTGNSARSPIAEALLRHRTAGRVEAASAGTVPKPGLHPGTVRVLRQEYGLDVPDRRPAPVTGLAGRRFDYLVTLCDKARETCPEVAGRPRRIHWSIPDPAGAAHREFVRVAAEIDTRVRHLVPVLTRRPPEVRP